MLTPDDWKKSLNHWCKDILSYKKDDDPVPKALSDCKVKSLHDIVHGADFQDNKLDELWYLVKGSQKNTYDKIAVHPACCLGSQLHIQYHGVTQPYGLQGPLGSGHHSSGNQECPCTSVRGISCGFHGSSWSLIEQIHIAK